MGNRLCGTNQPTIKKNKSNAHYHREIILDEMGRSNTSEGLQRINNNTFSI
jgi:hypothetical protein